MAAGMHHGGRGMTGLGGGREVAFLSDDGGGRGLRRLRAGCEAGVQPDAGRPWECEGA